MADHLPSPDDAAAAGPAEDLSFDCPRCRAAVVARYWGPCPDCRSDLADRLAREPTIVDVGAFEPAMHVVPNQVATKE